MSKILLIVEKCNYGGAWAGMGIGFTVAFCTSQLRSCENPAETQNGFSYTGTESGKSYKFIATTTAINEN